MLPSLHFQGFTNTVCKAHANLNDSDLWCFYNQLQKYGRRIQGAKYS